jgi:zinc carboxypeptidase
MIGIPLLFGALAGPVLLAGTGQAANHRRVEIAFNRFYDYEELVGHFRRLHEAYPALTRLESIGKSHEGRDLWILTIANSGTGPEERKAAMWIDGNVHGNEVQGGEAALYAAWYLLENHGRLEAVTRLVDDRVFYALPSQNPDGRAHWFAAANDPSSSRSGKRPLDNDRDGVADEDGPDDLDGDGNLCQMRKRVPDGTHRLDPDDPRVMVPVEPGKTGEWILLGIEGIDNDGDGRINEDGPGGYDLNRNWPSDWLPDYVQFGAGEYPLSHPESRAIADFLLAHPNVAAVQSFHNAGGMILRGPGAQERGEAYPAADERVYDRIGADGEFMLPFYRYMVIWRDLYTVHGGFVNWTYEGLGIYSFTNELWASPQYSGGKGDLDPKARLKWNDLLMLGEEFVPWHEATHPRYGAIEIGGMKKMTGRVPPPWMIEEMCHRNAAFCLRHADAMPKVEVEPLEVEPLGQGTFGVTATVRNLGLIPTRSARASGKRLGRPDILTIAGPGATVVGGGPLPERFRPESVSLVEDEPARLVLEQGLGSHERRRFRWIVRGTGEIAVTYDAEKGGIATARAPLR